MAQENENNLENENIQDEIAAHNQSILDEEGAGEGEAIETGEETSEEVEIASEETGKETDETAVESGEPAEPAAFQFTENSDWDTFLSERNAYLESVEITPQLQTILDRQDALLTERASQISEFESFGGVETAKEIVTSFNKLFESELKEGDAQPNAAPLVQTLQKQVPGEFSAIAAEMFASDSLKYKGQSVFEEILIDQFGADEKKVQAIADFLSAPNASLPVPQTPTPKGVDSKLVDAWADVGEVKRFEIESLLEEIAEKAAERDAEDNPYLKQTLEAELGEKQKQLNAEISLLQKVQNGIDSQKQQVATAQRRQFEARAQFEQRVEQSYLKDIFNLADSFAKDLAPKLSFVDETAQLSASRDILARVQNALAFGYDADGKMVEDPHAERFAKQLQDEGVKFDFAKGRNLLHSYLQATRKVELLTDKVNRRQASPPALEQARRERENLMRDIKTEYRELQGQLSAKYVKSAGNALKSKVDKIAGDKQKARAVVVKGAAKSQSAGGGDVSRDIAAYNKRRAAEIANGDDLFASYAE